MDDNGGFPLFGLTKREWLAGMALQGILSNPNPEITKYTFVGDHSTVAHWAFDYAAAMLAHESPEKGK